MDTPIFYIALFAHLICLIVAFGSVIVIDTFGLLWLLKKKTLEEVGRVADVTQRLIWTGYGGMILSGIVLITKKGFIDELTWIKIFFVFMVGVNGYFLHLIKKSMGPYEAQNAVPPIIKFRMGITTAISQTGWWGAILIGFLHRNWNHYIPWPTHPWVYMIGIALVFFAVWQIGEKVLEKKN
jgi:hypothetical protein